MASEELLLLEGETEEGSECDDLSESSKKSEGAELSSDLGGRWKEVPPHLVIYFKILYNAEWFLL